MNPDTIQISPLINEVTLKRKGIDSYTVCWVKDGIIEIEINGVRYADVENSVFFLHPSYEWKIIKKDDSIASGYILSLPRKILNDPTFKNFQISEVSLLINTEILKIILTPGIEKRVQSILEMLDELISTNLSHKEEAILGLLNTFFVYCDGKCNIKSNIADNNSRSALVYKYKKSVDSFISKNHLVSEYAAMLNVSDKYLNECTQDVLGTNAKSLIDEQLVMRSRYELKFTDRTVKEIAFGLGFSSPDYFSAFCKKHMGCSPSRFRKL